MKTKTLFLALPILATLLPLAAQAQSQKSINERQRHQQERISTGLRNGALTKSEAAALEARTRRINEAEARARRSGGRLTPAEHARIERELNQTSNAIHNQAWDRQRSRSSYNVNGRQYNQQQRIRDGARNGSLTNVEARRLQEREARLRYLEARDHHTGNRLTPAERADLQRHLNRDSRSIYKQKHDWQHR